MLQKIILAIAIFLIVLAALTFGDTVAQQLFAWLSHLTGLVIYNFSDLFYWARDYVSENASKVILALVLTVPITAWILRNQGEHLKKPGANRRIAIVLAFLLGWLGAHRFYLGQIGWGLTYLIVFYLFTPLAVIAGLIDGLRYVFMTDAQFPQIDS